MQKVKGMAWPVTWVAAVMILMGIVGARELKYRQLDQEMTQTVERYEHWIDAVISDTAKMERDLKIYRMELARRSYREDMPAKEFLQIMADYLSKDGRCEVVVKTVDWSTWIGAHK